ncbi:MAG TPA: GrpB family protein [Candidatus Binatia bacterium]|nr:GrpB family protein [Candidatus Binatia bacterium]
MRHPNPIVIESYDPSWPRRFEAERSAFQRIFGCQVRIDHIGSTAVPALGAKPIIDILLGAVKLKEIESHLPELIAAAWSTCLNMKRYCRSGADL